MLMSYFISDVYKRETNPIVLYEVISKRKMVLDQLKKGLITHAVLDVMSEHPYLFECVHLKTR